jgi:virulence factor Mce-like protein
LVLPAGFALVCVVLTLLVLRVFGGTLPLSANGYRVTIPLPQATNLVPGSGVQIAGVKIGKVVDVRRVGTSADATVELASRFAPLHAGAVAIARTKTLLGEGYIELAPGPRSALAIPDGGRLSSSQVRPQVQLDEFVSTFAPSTRARLRRLLAGLAGAFAGRSTALNDSVAAAAPFASGLNGVATTLASQQGDVQHLFSASADVLNAVGRRAGLLQAAVRNGNAALDVTARQQRGLEATVRALPGFLSELHRAADSITAASPDLNAAVDALLPVGPQVVPALRNIDAAAPVFRRLFASLPAVLAAGDSGLPALTPLTRAAGAAFRQFYPTARELIPFMQLFGLNKNIVGILANVGNVTNGTYVGPGGVVLNYGVGIPSVWNETISGWKKKLPTNRQNPYPKPPDGLLDTGRIGVLKAYDCRNTGNILWLPPIGPGAPPCILQGPWTFNGVSAYYPRLQLAPP